MCWGLTSQSTIFQSCRDGAIASWVINQYFQGVKCLAQGHNTAAVGFEPPTSRSGVRHSTTEPMRSPKKLYKIRLQRHCFETFNIWMKWQDISVDIKTLSLGAVCPCPGLYTCIKSCKKEKKNCIKSDFKDIFLKLATNERWDKTFL